MMEESLRQQNTEVAYMLEKPVWSLVKRKLAKRHDLVLVWNRFQVKTISMISQFLVYMYDNVYQTQQNYESNVG